MYIFAQWALVVHQCGLMLNSRPVSTNGSLIHNSGDVCVESPGGGDARRGAWGVGCAPAEGPPPPWGPGGDRLG